MSAPSRIAEDCLKRRAPQCRNSPILEQQWIDRFVDEVEKLLPELDLEQVAAVAGAFYFKAGEPDPEKAAVNYAVELMERILGPGPQ